VTTPHALDCAHARELIDLFLLDDLLAADAADLAAHVKGCAACTAEIGSSTRVLGLLGSLPVPRPSADLDERILLAALDDRTRRHQRRSWLSDLRNQVIRGAMRTTGTLIVTILTVALLGGAFVFAASQIVVPVFNAVGPRATIAPVATPTTSVPAAQTAEPSTTATARPSPVDSATPEPVITPVPTVEPTVSAEPSATPTPTPTPEVSPTSEVSPTPDPSASATAEPTPTPTPTPEPSPTEKPRRTPPPSAEPPPSP
jgi:cytoskeletal protein RodZ